MSKRLFPYLLAFLPWIALAYGLYFYTVDAPFWDQWALVPLLEKVDIGAFRFADLWAAHNGHRLVFPQIIMLGLARLSRWNIGYEYATSFLLATINAILLVMLLNRCGGQGRRAHSWWVPITVSLLTFSYNQWGNWFLGWQLQIFLNLTGFLLMLYWLTSPTLQGPYVVAAIASALLATFSFASGILAWPIGFVILVARKSCRHRVLLWVIVSITVVAAYAIDLSGGSEKTEPVALFQRILYIPAYLGAPLALARTWLAVAIGSAALASAFLLISFQRNTDDEALRVARLALIGIALYAIGSAVLTVFARGALGIEQALSSRYITIALLIFLAPLPLLADAGSPRGIRTRWVVTVSLVTMAALNSIHGAYIWSLRYPARLAMRDALIRGEENAMFKRMYPDIGYLREKRQTLRRLRLSVFRDTPETRDGEQ